MTIVNLGKTSLTRDAEFAIPPPSPIPWIKNRELCTSTKCVDHRAARRFAEVTPPNGLAAAFGLASCCGLPFLLASMGLGTAWLTGFALLAAPHRSI
jgi:hypothetical protein